MMKMMVMKVMKIKMMVMKMMITMERIACGTAWARCAFGLGIFRALCFLFGISGLALISAAADEVHWAFVAPGRTEVPGVRETSWIANPIDAFVLARLEERGWAHAAEADRATLLRRLSYDLTGLPPSPEELENFLADGSPLAYDRLVDRLLASPHLGERWGQHWLDLARFAETDGFEFDQARPDAWRYRDWVVQALNRDLPYDTFVRLQLAGDQVRPGDPAAFIATGFNRCYPDMVDLNDQGLRRQNALNDITETTGLVFLGLTIGCARCHDHKFDPIRQTDFYALQAFFASARFRDDYPLSSADERRARDRSGGRVSAKARGIDEPGGPVPATYLLRRGEFGARGPEIAPSFPAVLRASHSREALSPGPLARSAGRRSALADWLVRPDHPLTARVMVNRIWRHHFGRGLVDTPSDFGTMGDEPTHPELLDWLATEFVARGWSTKAMHRLIVTSATYRQRSRADGRGPTDDPENALLWRQNRRRLDGEAIRDSLLAVSGRLNRAMGGRSVFPELPPELSRLSSKGAVWPVSPRTEDRERRSLYVFVRRNLRYPFFEVFDRPDTNASCPQRAVTTIAPQALSLLNSPLARDAARALAARALGEAGPDPARQLEWMGRLVFGRPPDDAERRLIGQFRAHDGSLYHLCLAILNTNAFVYVD